eukprot:6176470-Pleurochrysis_carterae.AAC.1
MALLIPVIWHGRLSNKRPVTGAIQPEVFATFNAFGTREPMMLYMYESFLKHDMLKSASGDMPPGTGATSSQVERVPFAVPAHIAASAANKRRGKQAADVAIVRDITQASLVIAQTDAEAASEIY